MAKDKTTFTCTECGGTSPRWLGKCPSCGAWNTLIEQVAEAGPGKNRLSAPQGYAGLAHAQPVMPLAAIEAQDVARTPSGIEELDRVLGGGIVEGGVVLIGGDPGIGKSTLLLQAMDALQRAGLPALYVTGEESGAQVALRSRRLGIDGSQVQLLAEIQLEKILATLQAVRPQVAVIDSIQTVYSDALTSAPGSVAQVRECAAHLTRFAKAQGTSVVLVGHVTKDGGIAGPRTLVYLYERQLDHCGHGEGWRSDAWADTLAFVDGLARALRLALYCLLIVAAAALAGGSTALAAGWRWAGQPHHAACVAGSGPPSSLRCQLQSTGSSELLFSATYCTEKSWATNARVRMAKARPTSGSMT